MDSSLEQTKGSQTNLTPKFFGAEQLSGVGGSLVHFCGAPHTKLQESTKLVDLEFPTIYP
jgi:hypothetical protein